MNAAQRFLSRPAVWGVLIAVALLAGRGLTRTSADELFAGSGDARDPAVLAALIESSRDQFMLIDVRTPGEFRSGHIPTAQNIDHREVGAALAEGDRDVPVVVYCRTGSRSGRATRELRRLGYTVVDFGGISRWPGAIETGDQ